jgi:hypothetical protein
MKAYLNYNGPANQCVVTEAIIEFLQVNVTLPSMVMGDKTNLSGVYNISSKLYFWIPERVSRLGSHPPRFDQSYWYFFCRILVHRYCSSRRIHYLLIRPFWNWSVRLPSRASTTRSRYRHELIQMLRAGSIESAKSNKAIGVGPSLGSELANAITAQRPKTSTPQSGRRHKRPILPLLRT